MPIGVATSVEGVSIRLTEERWEHIIKGHVVLRGRQAEVLEAIERPDQVLAGEESELLAVRKKDGLYLIVVYREVDTQDGFVVTAYLTRRPARRPVVWKS